MSDNTFYLYDSAKKCFRKSWASRRTINVTMNEAKQIIELKKKGFTYEKILKQLVWFHDIRTINTIENFYQNYQQGKMDVAIKWYNDGSPINERASYCKNQMKASIEKIEKKTPEKIKEMNKNLKAVENLHRPKKKESEEFSFQEIMYSVLMEKAREEDVIILNGVEFVRKGSLFNRLKNFWFGKILGSDSV